MYKKWNSKKPSGSVWRAYTHTHWVHKLHLRDCSAHLKKWCCITYVLTFAVIRLVVWKYKSAEYKNGWRKGNGIQVREVNVNALESTSDGYAEDMLYALYVAFRAKEKENEKKACHQNRYFFTERSLESISEKVSCFSFLTLFLIKLRVFLCVNIKKATTLWDKPRRKM